MTKSTVIAVVPEEQRNLSSVIRANAQIAMPEVVSVFISKHETELYDLKAELQKKIGDLKKDIEMHTATTSKSVSFKKYAGLKMLKLNLISYLKGDPSISWADEQVSQTVGLYNTKDDNSEAADSRDRHTGFEKSYSQPILASHIKAHTKMTDELAETSTRLASIVGQIGDMSRVERQVKARISEMRLEEQGLSGFLKDPEMQKLIAIK